MHFRFTSSTSGSAGENLDMKCPRCWTEKAFVRPVSVWKDALLSCLFMVPMKCQHCYHKFTVPWLFTIGKQIRPPVLRIAPASRDAGPSFAARHYAARRRAAVDLPSGQEGPRRADAA
jgi:hypothetical protein